MGDITWTTAIGWGALLAIVAVAVKLTQGGFRTYSCSVCGGYRRRVCYVQAEDGHELYACRVCGAVYVREPGKKLVAYELWKAGDGLPAARVVSKPGRPSERP